MVTFCFNVHWRKSCAADRTLSGRPPPPPSAPAVSHAPPSPRDPTPRPARWRMALRVVRRLLYSAYDSVRASLSLFLVAIFLAFIGHVPFDLSQQAALDFLYKTCCCYFGFDFVYAVAGRLLPKFRPRLALALGCAEFLLSLDAMDALLNGRRRTSFRRLSNACSGQFDYVACTGCYGDERDVNIDILLVTFVVFFRRHRCWDLVDRIEEKRKIKDKMASVLWSIVWFFIGLLLGVMALYLSLTLLNFSFGYRRKVAPDEVWIHVTRLLQSLIVMDCLGAIVSWFRPYWTDTLIAVTSALEYWTMVTWCQHFSSSPVDPRDLSDVMVSLARNITSPEMFARYLDPDYASRVLIGSRSGCFGSANAARINDELSVVCSMVDAHKFRGHLLNIVLTGVILFRPRNLWR